MKNEKNCANIGENNMVKNGLPDSFGASARPIVTVDVEMYQAWLDGSDLSLAQKEEFLQALWSIVVTFVELGFGVHPLQGVCGQNSADGAAGERMAFHAVKWKKSESTRPSIYSSQPGAVEGE